MEHRPIALNTVPYSKMGLVKAELHGNKIGIRGPSNRLAPDLPGCSIRSDFSKTNKSLLKGAGLPVAGKIIGQNGAEGHSGTTRVPLARHLLAWWITHGMRHTGGQSQLTSLDQSQVNASTASVPGFQRHELKCGSCAL